MSARVPLTAAERAVVARHLARAGEADGARVPQWAGASSVYYAATKRLRRAGCSGGDVRRFRDRLD